MITKYKQVSVYAEYLLHHICMSGCKNHTVFMCIVVLSKHVQKTFATVYEILILVIITVNNLVNYANSQNCLLSSQKN